MMKSQERFHKLFSYKIISFFMIESKTFTSNGNMKGYMYVQKKTLL